jgi:hypothetical protein
MGKTTEKITNSMKDKLISLYEEGKMDTEIAKILNVSRSAIYYWRKQLDLKTKFTYDKISKINNKKFEELFNKGLSDKIIAEKLNMSPDGIYSHRMRYNYKRENLNRNKAIKLSEFQKQVLIGTLLGDSSLIKRGNQNTKISCEHCIAQKEYCEYKTKIFESLGAKCYYAERKTVDKRNNKLYKSYVMSVPANPELNDWKNLFYINKKKVIPFNLFNNFTEVSLAFMYMDDGSKTTNGYTISTNCFNKEELLQFRKFLFNKFNIETSLFKRNVLYIRAISKNTFTKLISPYFCNCMKYKLHSVS